MALTDAQRFQIRFYLGFPDLSSLPSADTEDPDEIVLLQKSSELEVRMTNIGATAETKVIDLLERLDAAFNGFDSIQTRIPFKRIEDITFRDNEFALRWELNSGTINSLASILGITPLTSINPGGIGLAVV
jgi:hypothetical protein